MLKAARWILATFTLVAAAVPAQTAGGYDVHAVFCERPEGPELPRCVLLGTRRLAFPPEVDAKGLMQAAEVASVGSLPGVSEILLSRQGPEARLVYLELTSRRRRGSTMMASLRPAGTALVEPVGWGDRRWLPGYGRGRNLLVLVPLAGGEQPLAKTSLDELLRALVARLLRNPDEIAHGVLELLVAIPLERHLDLEDRERLIARLREGDAPQASRERMMFEVPLSGEDLAGAVRLLAGDADPARAWLRAYETHEARPFALRRPLLIAGFATDDPVRKGLCLWLATVATGDLDGVRFLADLVATGDAVVPGEGETLARRRFELDVFAAQTRIGPPLLGLGASALALLLLVNALARASRRALS